MLIGRKSMAQAAEAGVAGLQRYARRDPWEPSGASSVEMTLPGETPLAEMTTTQPLGLGGRLGACARRFASERVSPVECVFISLLVIILGLALVCIFLVANYYYQYEK